MGVAFIIVVSLRAVAVGLETPSHRNVWRYCLCNLCDARSGSRDNVSQNRERGMSICAVRRTRILRARRIGPPAAARRQSGSYAKLEGAQFTEMSRDDPLDRASNLHEKEPAMSSQGALESSVCR